jgi:hypothetical protein
MSYIRDLDNIDNPLYVWEEESEDLFIIVKKDSNWIAEEQDFDKNLVKIKITKEQFRIIKRRILIDTFEKIIRDLK